MATSTPVLTALAVPIVQAPMAGGPSTPQLAAAVNRGGGLGFLAAGYLTPAQLADDIKTLRGLSEKPFGVNLFVGGGKPADPGEVKRYAARLRPLADQAGVQLGEPRFDDDAFAEKAGLLTAEPPAVVSFTFGLPPAETVRALQEKGSEVWITVTSPAEAVAAAALGPDALVVQGVEAGGHRGVFVDDDQQPNLTLLAALPLIGAVTDLPLVAAGGIMTGAALAAVLAAGAQAGQLGSAYLRSAEAGTSPVHRDAVASPRETVLTRAFSGRTARGIASRWHDEYGQHAPRAYPEVHYLTAPLRARGRQEGDPDLVNLWAGQAHALAQDGPAEEITRALGREAQEARNPRPPFHLAIPVDDLPRAEAFYGGVLGLPRGRSSSQWIDWNLAGHQIVTHLTKGEREERERNPVDGHDVPVPHFGLVLPVEEFHRLAGRLSKAGTKFEIEPYVRFAGQTGEQWTMFFYDPAGNPLEFKAFADLSQLFESGQ